MDEEIVTVELTPQELKRLIDAMQVVLDAREATGHSNSGQEGTLLLKLMRERESK